eukprot:TRINITY_DN3925_c5_g1_i1.p1 TRINITY_DN3925_c5_g1~~TRINITY_DN3925_c5_g1_i1.p1  ORF type:complete len:826 (+),score=258.54 TRINITY_DN3925_c5_g1_i1:45-2522(+)
MRALLAAALVPAVSATCPGAGKGADVVVWQDGKGGAALRNGYVCAVLSPGGITALYGDFQGTGSFSSAVNVVSAPGVVLAVDAKDSGHLSHNTSASGVPAKVSVSGGGDAGAVTLTGVNTGAASPVHETWSLSLKKGSRAVELTVAGAYAASTAGVINVRHTVSSPLLSVTAFLDGGVTQMMEDTRFPRFYTQRSLGAVYMVGQDGPRDASGTPVRTSDNEGGALLVVPVNVGNASVLLSAAPHTKTGYEEVVFGAAWANPDTWGTGSWDSDSVSALPPPGTAYKSVWTLSPNNFDFPAKGLSDDGSSITAPAPSVDDERSVLTGVYASAAGCLKGPYTVGGDEPGGSSKRSGGDIAPSISHPATGYTPNTNFFDPDSYLTISAMLYSGDPYLMVQARGVLEKTLSGMLPSGQVPHHYSYEQKHYNSLASSEQPGPNMFWLLTCLQYVKLSGDVQWLKDKAGQFRTSVGFLQSFWDPSAGLFKMPGPLWVDVLVREGYTVESNGALPLLLREWAAAEATLGNQSGAATLNAQADGIRAAFDALLWDNASDDHYITQVKDGVRRDFVDYDGNLLAIAFGAAPDNRIEPTLKRVDGGKCTHAFPTYVSEKPYSGQRSDCYIVGGQYCGDSVVTMGRVAWADAHARKRARDIKSLDSEIISPVQSKLQNHTWMYERYTCGAQGIRTPFFFEYPSVLAMLLREIRYGLNVGLQSVDIDPLQALKTPGEGYAFKWRIGNVFVAYNSSEGLDASVPAAAAPDNVKQWRVHGLKAGEKFGITTTVRNTDVCKGTPSANCVQPEQKASASSSGVLSFKAPSGVCCTVSVRVAQ